MRKLMFLFIFVLVLFPLSSGLTYKVGINYSNNSFSISSVDVDYFSEPDESSGELSLVMKDSDNEVLYVHNFDFEATITRHDFDPDTGEYVGEELELLGITFDFTLPYFPEVATIEILAPNSKKLTEKVLEEFDFEVSKISEDDLRVSSEEVRDEEKKVIEEEKQEESSVIETLADNLWIFVVIFVVLLIVFLYSLFRRKK